MSINHRNTSVFPHSRVPEPVSQSKSENNIGFLLRNNENSNFDVGRMNTLLTRVERREKVHQEQVFVFAQDFSLEQGDNMQLKNSISAGPEAQELSYRQREGRETFDLH